MKSTRNAGCLALASLCLWGLFALPAGAAEPDQENHTVLANFTQVVYDGDSGLPSGGANDILQTRDGYIWVAGYNGLVRYDGDRFVTYNPDNNGAFASSSIIALFEDSQNRLWVGTNGKGALVLQNGRFQRVASDPLSVQAFAEMDDGTIVLGAREGLFTVDETLAAQPAGIPHADTSASELIVDTAGRLWIIDTNGQLFVPQGVAVDIDDALAYSGLYEDSIGDIYIGSETGEVVHLKKRGDNYEPRIISTGLYRIHDFCENPIGSVWLCADTGLGFISGQSFQSADGAEITSSMETIIRDHEGSLWVASSRSGLLQLVPNKVKNISFAGQLGKETINSALDFGGNIYIGADDRLIILDRGHRRVQNELTDMLEGIRVRCLADDGAGHLWIATYDKYGVVQYTQSGEITSITTEDGLSSNKVRVVLPTSDGGVWVGSAEGVDLVREGKVVESYGKEQGFSNTVVLTLSEDRAGRLFVGTDGGGIYCIDKGKVAPIDVGELDSGVILCILSDEQDGSLWIATSASFYHYSGQLTELSHVPTGIDQVFDIVPDRRGKLWLLGSSGILYGSPEELLSGQNLHSLHKKDGLPYSTTANSFGRLDQNGNLYLCGTKGLGLIDTNSYALSTPATKLVVEQLVADNTEMALAENIALPSGTRRVTIKVVTPHFSPKSDIRVEYYLENFDDGWQVQSLNGLGEITYTNLRGGNYTFHVKAQNGDGAFTEEQLIHIYKEPTALERPIVVASLMVMALAVLAAVGLIAVRAHTEKILRRQREYKKITDQAIATISNAIDAKDKYTEGHSERVAAYSVEIGKRMGMNEDELEHLNYIALLHDIGKIGISDNILNKPGKLTDDEFAIMKSHAPMGGDILKDFTAIKDIGDGAHSHHEKYDGSGYPHGLKGDEISLIARIIGVCDTYDAMATRRSYKEPNNDDYMLGELKRCSGTQFDPEIAEIMIKMIEEGFHLEPPARPPDESAGKPEKA